MQSAEEIKEKVTKMKLKRRKAIAEEACKSAMSVKPNALMNLLGDAFKWRRHCGFVSDRMLSNNDTAGFDVFSDRSNLKDIFSHSDPVEVGRKNKDTAREKTNTIIKTSTTITFESRNGRSVSLGRSLQLIASLFRQISSVATGTVRMVLSSCGNFPMRKNFQ